MSELHLGSPTAAGEPPAAALCGFRRHRRHEIRLVLRRVLVDMAGFATLAFVKPGQAWSAATRATWSAR
jgi:hypothetical protein